MRQNRQLYPSGSAQRRQVRDSHRNVSGRRGSHDGLSANCCSRSAPFGDHAR